MEIGFVGLGRMGGNMVRRIIDAGHKVVAYDRSETAVAEAEGHGAIGVSGLAQLVAQLPSPRVVWLMVPAGPPVKATVEELGPLLSPGDVVVDGGNSDFRQSLERALWLRQYDVNFVDCGTSGGLWGLTVGFCLMVGGRREDFERIEPVLQALAAPDGYAHVGPVGAGHYTKMVHNGIEYALLQAYAEGFELLKAADFPADLARISELWNHGSVIRSWILELAAAEFKENPDMSGIRGYIEDTGYGRNTVREAVERAVPAPVITLSLMTRFRSRQDDSFAARVIAALREGFGGHRVLHT